MASRRILVFAPYGSWSVHHQLDAVVGSALALRGAETRVLACDGLLKDCTVAGKPANEETCRVCAQSGAHLFSSFGLAVAQMRSLLGSEDFREAETWSESLPVESLKEAEFEGIGLGAASQSTLLSYFMVAKMDYSLERMAEVSRSYLRNGALIVRATRKLLSAWRPDHAFCFNGIQAPYRVFFEVCREAGIPVLCHERGSTHDRFALYENHSTGDYPKRFRAWLPWKEIPLTSAQLSAVKERFDGMERGQNMVRPVYDFGTDPVVARRQLRIPEGKQVIGLFTTSDWEMGVSSTIHEFTFPDQLEWIRSTVKFAREHGVFLIIRHHPNNAKADSVCSAFLTAILEMNREMPENVRVMMPSEPVTTYGLLASIDCAVTYFTTVGGEASIRGIPSVCVGDSVYMGMGQEYVRRKEDYHGALLRALSRSRAETLESVRMAYRAAYFMYFRSSLEFKAFGMKDGVAMDLRFQRAEDLMPGACPVMDAVCAHVLEGSPILAAPPVTPDAAALRAETAFLEDELRVQEGKRARVRASAAKPSAALLTVLRPKAGDGRSPVDLDAALRRSRHREFEIREFDPAGRDPGRLIDSLSEALRTARGEFAYVASPFVDPDESVFSGAIDFLSDAANASVPSMWRGTWVCDKFGEIRERLFADQGLPAIENEAERLPGLENPLTLLAFHVMRVSALKAWIAAWRAASDASMRKLAYRVFADCCGGSAYRARVPLFALYPEEPDDLPMGERALLFRIAGELGRAREFYQAAWRENPKDPDIASGYVEVLVKMGRSDEARGILPEAVPPRHGEGWRAVPPVPPASTPISRMPMPQQPNMPIDPPAPSSAQLAAGPREYSEIKAKVDTVEGWLLEGQEKYLFDRVKALPDGAVVLEMGANFGRSTCAMAFACVGTRKRIYSIDTFTGNDGVMGKSKDFYQVWLGNLQRLGLDGYVTALRGFTFDVLKDRSRFPAPSFVFIDASHEYFDVLQDFKDIYDYVPEGGWIAFHDVEVNWPGPWRLWLDFAPYLFTDHQRVATLACGRKSVARPFGRGPGKAPGFSFAEALIREFDARYSASAPLCRALRTSYAGDLSSQAGREAVTQAEIRIAEAPEADFRSALVNMLSVKDGGMDGHILMWSGLTLIAEGKVEAAHANLREAPLVSYPVSRDRVAPYLKLLRENGRTPLPPDDPVPDARYGFLGSSVREGDVVLALASGHGEILRAVGGKKKIGVEADRESRKEAIVKYGIDGVEDASELPEGCADVLLCGDGFASSGSPLASLRAMRPRLKPGGRLAMSLPVSGREPADACYSWNAVTLANLCRAAGFTITSPPRETGGRLVLGAENP